VLESVSFRCLAGVAACSILGLACGSLSAKQVEQTPPAAPPVAKSHLRQALPRRQYLCANGASVVVLLEPNAVRLTFNGQIHNLKQIESSSGSKYSDGTVVWSVSGDIGALEDVSEKDNPKYLAENCDLESSYPPVVPGAGTVTGNITYPDSLVLPPEAKVIVELKDITTAGVPSQTIAVYKAPLGHPNGPVPFKISANPAKIDPKHRYGLEVRIVVGEDVKAIHALYYQVLTQGNPAKVDVVLVEAGTPKVWKN
jgi:uncharacterized lipoprotein YbaY/membrane-bound inhibitor of C-type lysozyme